MSTTLKEINVSQRSRRINSEAKLVNYIKTQLGEPLITVDVTEDQILQCIDDAFIKFTDWAYDAQQHQTFIIETIKGINDYILDERVNAIYDISIADTTTSYASAGGSIDLGGFGLLPINYVPHVTIEGNVSSLERAGLSEGATGIAGGVSGPASGGGSQGDKLQAAWAAVAGAQTMQNLFGRSVSFDFNSQNHTLRLFEEYEGPIVIEAALEYIPNPEYDDIYGHAWIKKYALNLTKFVWGQNVSKYSASLIGGTEINGDRIIQEAREDLAILEEELLEKYSEPLGIFSS